jgi:hypothetical protein
MVGCRVIDRRRVVRILHDRIYDLCLCDRLRRCEFRASRFFADARFVSRSGARHCGNLSSGRTRAQVWVASELGFLSFGSDYWFPEQLPFGRIARCGQKNPWLMEARSLHFLY